MELIVNSDIIRSGECYQYDSMKHRLDDVFYKLYYGMVANDQDALHQYMELVDGVVNDPETKRIDIKSDTTLPEMYACLAATPNELHRREIHNQYLFARLTDDHHKTTLHMLVRLDHIRYMSECEEFMKTPNENIFIYLLSIDGDDTITMMFDDVKWCTFKLSNE